MKYIIIVTANCLNADHAALVVRELRACQLPGNGVLIGDAQPAVQPDSAPQITITPGIVSTPPGGS